MSGCISSRLKFGNETFEKPHRTTLKQSSYPKIGERIFFETFLSSLKILKYTHLNVECV